MSFSISRVLVVAVVSIVAAGCSTREAPIATPVDTAKTPTFGSSTYSYDQPNSPLYTQAGQNGGKPVTLPSIAPTSRFDQNAPLGSEVYGALQSKLGAELVRYVTVQSKGSTVLVGGTVQSVSIKSKVTSIAKNQAGVKMIIDRLEVRPG